MKRKIYNTLYIWEILYPILFCVGVIVLQLSFYFRLQDNTQYDEVQKSTPLELFPAFIMFGLIIFFVVYMLLRFVIMDDNGVRYRYLKKDYFIKWEDVKYVKVSLNSYDKVGYGSYLVIATNPYPLQHTDFRASTEGFVVMKYRRSALKLVEKHYTGEIIRAQK